MQFIGIEIEKIKNIESCSLELSLDKGIYAIVGTNGCGKSTVMLALSLLVKPSSIKLFTPRDYNEDSKISIRINNQSIECSFNDGNWITNQKSYLVRGYYEGSLFYGTRFYDADIVENLINTEKINEFVMPADPFIKEKLSLILHNDTSHYTDLYKMKNRIIAAKYKLKGVPYFIKRKETFISQYNMSSGECMLIKILDIINNYVLRNNYRKNEKLIFLIDEVEIALHPAAIDRLVKLFETISSEYEIDLVVYFSTHSVEIINLLKAKNIYLLENENGIITCTNPSYPNYSIRNLYVPNGYDFLIFVEDDLLKAIVEKVINSSNLFKSKTYHIVTSGCWGQTLSLHKDIIDRSILGIGKKIISILDGDIIEEANRIIKYKDIPKLFIPIKSIEKFLLKILITERNEKFIKLLGDKYFRQKTLKDILREYTVKYKIDNNGKKLYSYLCENLNKNGISNNEFVKYLCDDIFEFVDFAKFNTQLKAMME